jgi:hypothetical protein
MVGCRGDLFKPIRWMTFDRGIVCDVCRQVSGEAPGFSNIVSELSVA